MSALGELGTLGRKKPAGPKKDNLAAYLFLTPWLLGLFLITVGPMIASLYLAFTDYNLIQAPQWIGLENFTRMLSDQRLHNSLRVTGKAAGVHTVAATVCTTKPWPCACRIGAPMSQAATLLLHAVDLG